jgi:hypothetical protein
MRHLLIALLVSGAIASSQPQRAAKVNAAMRPLFLEAAEKSVDAIDDIQLSDGRLDYEAEDLRAKEAVESMGRSAKAGKEAAVGESISTLLLSTETCRMSLSAGLDPECQSRLRDSRREVLAQMGMMKHMGIWSKSTP